MMSGFHLVFIDSSEEQDYLAFTANSIKSAACSHDHGCEYWIGIMKGGNDEPTWMDGTPIIYDNFKPLDDEGTCFRLNSEEEFVWETHSCGNSHDGYICEREQGLCSEIIQSAVHALSNNNYKTINLFQLTACYWTRLDIVIC